MNIISHEADIGKNVPFGNFVTVAAGVTIGDDSVYVVGAAGRDHIQDQLKQSNIATMIHYPIPPHLQKACAGMSPGVGSFPIAERLANEVLSLPLRPTMTATDVASVIQACNQWTG